jgi:NADPH2:quinone reductase
VGQLLGLNVIGTVSTAAKAESPAPMAATTPSTTAIEDVAQRVRELTDGAG